MQCSSATGGGQPTRHRQPLLLSVGVGSGGSSLVCAKGEAAARGCWVGSADMAIALRHAEIAADTSDTHTHTRTVTATHTAQVGACLRGLGSPSVSTWFGRLLLSESSRRRHPPSSPPPGDTRTARCFARQPPQLRGFVRQAPTSLPRPALRLAAGQAARRQSAHIPACRPRPTPQSPPPSPSRASLCRCLPPRSLPGLTGACGSSLSS